VLDPCERRARALKRPWALAAAARCRGLLFAASGELADAARALDQALAHYPGIDLPLERGRTLVVKGQVHRRRREKRRARDALEKASTIFDGLGARLWAQRARAELTRLGQRTRSPHALTHTPIHSPPTPAHPLPH